MYEEWGASPAPKLEERWGNSGGRGVSKRSIPKMFFTRLLPLILLKMDGRTPMW